MADALITEAELETYLGAALDTPAATLAIELATAVVQAAAGQRLVEVIDETITITLDGVANGSRWLDLPETPVTAVGAVLVGATTVTDAVADLTRGRLFRAIGWRSPALVYPREAPSTVTVTYSHGYDAGDQDLMFARQVALTVAAAVADNPTGVAREQIDDYMVQYATGGSAAGAVLPPVMAMALRRKYGRVRKSALLLRG